MSLTLGGSNSGAMRSLSYMSSTKSKMDKSLQRISSGQRILSASDDPGGLAVAMKLKSQISNYDAQKDSVENAKSYVESQSTALQTASEIVTKMQDLKSDYDDPTATAADQTAYESEFQDLQGQLNSIKGETLNGRKLFDRGASESQITVSNVALDDLGLDAALQNGGQDITDSDPASPTRITLDNVSDDNLEAIEGKVSVLAAEVAGDASTLGFASDYLTNMSTNLETAHGRIMDVDLAEETSNYATLSMQYEAAAAAVAQANVSSAKVLDLLLSSINRD